MPLPLVLRLALAVLSCQLRAASQTATAAPTATLSPPGQSEVTVTGVNSAGLDVFFGIPFAQPPVGELRFAHPQPATYNATFDAVTPGPACLQATTGSYEISEACLTLDIYTPPGAAGSSEKLPVLVWIYGGSFISGAASGANGSALVSFGIQTNKPFIFLALNYRVGVFGWGYGQAMAANGAANLGLRDQRLALEWVRDNIAPFGGDSSRVTLFGESAGAVSVSLHLLNTSQDLFHGAIMESGAQSTVPMGPTATTWQTPYDELTVLVSCAAPNTTATGNQSAFDCLKTLPAETLLNAQGTIKGNYPQAYIWGPSIDGELIPSSPYELLKNGLFAQIPFITGNTKDEGTNFVSTTLNSTTEVAEFLDTLLPNEMNETTQTQMFNVYPDIPANGSPFGTGNDTFGLEPEFKLAAAIYGDSTFQSRRRNFLRAVNSYGFKKTWTYQFEGETPGSAAYKGVTHGAEVAYVYGEATSTAGYTATDNSLSETMMTYWINFVYFLDPNGNGSVGPNETYWAPHEYPENKNMIQLDESNVTLIQDDYREVQMAYWDVIAVSLGF